MYALKKHAFLTTAEQKKGAEGEAGCIGERKRSGLRIYAVAENVYGVCRGGGLYN